MREFNVLPTDPRFQALNDEQIDFILYSMERDAIEIDRARRGIQVDGEFEDTDESWWYKDHEEFTALEPDDDEEDIAKQVDAMTTEEDMARLRERYRANEALDELEKTHANSINDIINQNLKALFDEADRLNQEGVSKWGDPIEKEEIEANRKIGGLESEGLREAVDIFEGKYEDDYI